MKKKYNKPRGIPTEMKVLKILQVPIELTLSEIVNELSYQVKSMLGIHRTCDFNIKKKTHDVFIILRDKVEYETLKESPVVFIGTNRFDVACSNYAFGCGTIMPRYSRLQAPVSIKLTGLAAISKKTTKYLTLLLNKFDDGKVSGITTAYDERRNSLKPFGFVSFIDMEAAQIFQSTTVNINARNISCVMAHRVPAIVTEFNKAILKGGIQQSYTDEVHRANLLCGVLMEAQVERDEEDDSDALSIHFDGELE
ncbi:hypothetical protein PVAND_001522 [Polypedilum vanderplanki]|uniref:Uncharacterized protein n=1 Tax=Polypedilum vanderplanki TaxID=319348 RepID=A0A9J6BPG3_POLVA|nr:hypothetical protein PVAND_001522 [Polypedilum vanderplanki]